MKIRSLCLALAALFTLGLGVARADGLADAKAFIGKQVGQLKAGDVAGLKAGFTDRFQDKITAEVVKKGADQAGKMTIDELVAGVEPAGDAMKIKMKNGRTLTTLVKAGAAWKADTLWFK